MQCGDYITKEQQRLLPIIRVSLACLIDSRKSVLICKEINHSNLWHFPGGKIEDAETPEYALVRELNEELDIIIHPSCLYPISFSSYSYNKYHLIIYLYGCRNWQNEPKAKELQQLKWVNKFELTKHSMPDANKNLVASIFDSL